MALFDWPPHIRTDVLTYPRFASSCNPALYEIISWVIPTHLPGPRFVLLDFFPRRDLFRADPVTFVLGFRYSLFDIYLTRQVF
jgi:hypothetical protein